MINPNWSRWIYASVSKHFYDNINDTVPVVLEGAIKDYFKLGDVVEVRMDGPNFTETTSNTYQVYLEVNCLISHKITNDLHKIYRTMGLVQSVFTSIPLYRYGDDGEWFGCLDLLQDARGRQILQTSYFGQIDISTQLEQASIEGHYRFYLKN